MPRLHRLLLASAAVLLGACDTDPLPETPFFPLDAPAKWVEVRDCRKSIEHSFEGLDEPNIRVFAEGATATAYADGKYPFASGAVIVKAEYDFEDKACATPVRFSAMKKDPAPAFSATGGWKWQKVLPSGEVLQSGAVKTCASCHLGRQECVDKDATCANP